MDKVPKNHYNQYEKVCSWSYILPSGRYKGNNPANVIKRPQFPYSQVLMDNYSTYLWIEEVT
jgi:hypothetical protein